MGGPCEGCEAIYEYGNISLNNTDTLPHYSETKPKIKLTGTVYQSDGKTPAGDVILYIYHTDRDGRYRNFLNEEGWGRRHGSLRGWIKTGADGRYTFYTFRPSSYPNSTEPEHIHLTVKEPNKNEYYVDNFLFDDDPLLTKEMRENLKERAGSGVMTFKMENGLMTGHRDIILGKNIPNYY